MDDVELLEKLGFQTGKVVLPGLDLEVELSRDKWFKDGGTVLDVNSRANSLSRELGCDGTFPWKPCGGLHASWEVSDVCAGPYKLSFICVQEFDDILKTFVYGHESTHAVVYLGLEDHFMRMMHSLGFTLNPFERYSDPEDIADIGGLVSVYKKYDIICHDPEIDHLKEELRSSWRQTQVERQV